MLIHDKKVNPLEYHLDLIKHYILFHLLKQHPLLMMVIDGYYEFQKLSLLADIYLIMYQQYALAEPVPFGTYGTIVGIDNETRSVSVVFDKPLACGTKLDGKLKSNRGMRLMEREVFCI